MPRQGRIPMAMVLLMVDLLMVETDIPEVHFRSCLNLAGMLSKLEYLGS